MEVFNSKEYEWSDITTVVRSPCYKVKGYYLYQKAGKGSPVR